MQDKKIFSKTVIKFFFALAALTISGYCPFFPGLTGLTGYARAAVFGGQVNPASNGQNNNKNKIESAIKSGFVILNFRNVEISTLIDFISKITGKNFIYSGKIKGRITIISSKKIRIAEAYRAFLAALSYRGLTVVKSNGIYKIIPVNSARQNSIQVSVKKLYAAGSRFVTQIIGLKYLNAQSMAAILMPLLSPSANIESYLPTNSLVITDYASNIRKADKIIEALDVPNFGQKIAILQVKYVSVAKISRILGLIYTGSMGLTSTVGTINSQFVRIIPYNPSNSLIIMATPENMTRIIALAKALDVKVVSKSGALSIHVYRLKYAKAATIAKILTSVSSGSKKLTKSGSGPNPPPGIPLKNNNNAGRGGDGETALIGKAVIIPYKDDNSIIIEATGPQYKAILAVIKKLDIKRSQVFVQAIIAEVDITRSSEYGSEYFGQKGSFFGGGNYNMSQGVTNFLSNPFSVTGFIAGVVGGSMTLPIGPNGAMETVPSFAALFRLIKTDSAVNVLSAPDLLTLNNQKASIMVGEEVPFVTSSATSQIALQNIVTQVQQQDVGVQLNITPTINSGNYLMLKLDIQISAIIPSPEGMNVNLVGPTTSKRKIKTNVIVKNGQTVIIGGLMQNTVNNSTTKLPILGDLPLIGYLFKDKSTQIEKDNLVVLISPIIIKNNADISKITNGKNRKFLNFMNKSHQELPGVSHTVIVNPSYVKPVKK